MLQYDENPGIVFDIQRFALRDGPGIRTTVFLKGCPLSCLWCHNPESRSFRPQLSFDPEKCTDCLECVPACSTGALTVFDDRLSVRHELCNGCGDCVAACPEEALAVIGMDMTVETVLASVLRDRRYYERSGGGLTVSGGEPLAQPAFATALLRNAKLHGIHTCLDTSGAVHPRRIQDVMPYVDLFLYDYKASPHDSHRRLTGVSNELILENLEYLYEKGANIILRCPLIPGLNDSSQHLSRIAELSERYPRLAGIEIMAYHDMGRGKSARLGMTDPLAGLPTTPDATRLHWVDVLHSMGCERAVVG